MMGGERKESVDRWTERERETRDTDTRERKETEMTNRIDRDRDREIHRWETEATDIHNR